MDPAEAGMRGEHILRELQLLHLAGAMTGRLRETTASSPRYSFTTRFFITPPTRNRSTRSSCTSFGSILAGTV